MKIGSMIHTEVIIFLSSSWEKETVHFWWLSSKFIFNLLASFNLVSWEKSEPVALFYASLFWLRLKKHTDVCLSLCICLSTVYHLFNYHLVYHSYTDAYTSSSICTGILHLDIPLKLLFENISFSIRYSFIYKEWPQYIISFLIF